MARRKLKFFLTFAVIILAVVVLYGGLVGNKTSFCENKPAFQSDKPAFCPNETPFCQSKNKTDCNLLANKCLSLAEAMPSSNEKLISLDHKYYFVGYNPSHKQAAWVAYLLTSEMIRQNDNVSRGNTNFKKDPLLRKHYAISKDYSHSGYVRGHLCPSKDMCWSEASMRETFFMTNVSPQSEQFNNGLWKKLEKQVRTWALDNDSIIVLTGPVLSTKKAEIGENKVSVCGKFYKIVVDISYPSYKMIAFVMDNANIKGNVYKYSCTVRDVERLTGLDFFPSCEDNPLIDSLESHTDISLWKSEKIRTN